MHVARASVVTLPPAGGSSGGGNGGDSGGGGVRALCVELVGDRFLRR